MPTQPVNLSTVPAETTTERPSGGCGCGGCGCGAADGADA